jgi:hypothetical protein
LTGDWGGLISIYVDEKKKRRNKTQIHEVRAFVNLISTHTHEVSYQNCRQAMTVILGYGHGE